MKSAKLARLLFALLLIAALLALFPGCGGDAAYADTGTVTTPEPKASLEAPTVGDTAPGNTPTIVGVAPTPTPVKATPTPAATPTPKATATPPPKIIPTPKATPTRPPNTASSGDNDLRVFKVEFPGGASVDMSNRAARKSITIANVTSAKVTALASHNEAKVTGDIGNISLQPGLNEFSVKVTAKDGSEAYYDYAITVTSDDTVIINMEGGTGSSGDPAATLPLSITATLCWDMPGSGGTGSLPLGNMSPALADGVTDYAFTVSADNFMQVAAVDGLPYAVVTVTLPHPGATVTPSLSQRIDVEHGYTATASFTITPAQGGTSVTYNVTVTGEPRS